MSARAGDQGVVVVGAGGLKRMGWYQGPSAVRVLGKRAQPILFSSIDGEARTFNGSIELCRADSDSSQKVGPREMSGLG